MTQSMHEEVVRYKEVFSKNNAKKKGESNLGMGGMAFISDAIGKVMYSNEVQIWSNFVEMMPKSDFCLGGVGHAWHFDQAK